MFNEERIKIFKEVILKTIADFGFDRKGVNAASANTLAHILTYVEDLTDTQFVNIWVASILSLPDKRNGEQIKLIDAYFPLLLKYRNIE